MKKTILIILWLNIFSFCFPQNVFAAFWEMQSIDTMKFSRDIAREKDIIQRIPQYVTKVAELHPNYISIATPYDEEFLPVLKTWVSEARKHNLKIWFRGNWSSWEGWFGYQKFKDYKEHHQKTYEFLLTNESLFIDGDIFSPVMEPENGGLGDPRGSEEKTKLFREFLVTSYDTCQKAIKQMKPKIICGYFSVNGDIAREIFTPEIVAKTGNVVVIDHYVKTSMKLVEDIRMYHQKYNAPIVLGEIGGPIPDIHGQMTEAQQAAYISEVFSEVIKLGSIVKGVNYWTAFGGSTRLFENSLDTRLAATTIKRYFNPPQLLGVVTDQYGNRLDHVDIFLLGGAIRTVSDSAGRYALPFPGTFMEFEAKKQGKYEQVKETISSSGKEIQIKNVVLHRDAYFLVKIGLQLQGIISKIRSIFFQN